MRMTKKKVIALALVVCLIAILSLSSLAWFTDDDSVTNKFQIAGSEDANPDDIFSVDVWEKDDPTSNEKDQDGITYPDILPGDDLYKEVNVENTGKYPQYARVIVTVSDASIWQEIYGETFVPLNKIATDLSGDFMEWSITADEVKDTLVYVLYYEKVLEPAAIANLFTNVHIPEALDRDQAAKMAGGFDINVVAEAVQTENVGENAAQAFETVGKALPQGHFALIENTTIETNNTTSQIKEDTVITDATINSAEAGLQNMGADVVLNDVVMNAGSNADYSNILQGGTTEYNNVNITANGGGVGIVNGAKAVYNGGSVNIVSATTNPRYVFYIVGAGSELTINDGEFDFANKSLKRAYVYAGAGTTVYINGGTFGTAADRDGYRAGILGDGTVVITGGTFGFDPTNWVAAGYEAVQNGATWTVQAK